MLDVPARADLSIFWLGPLEAAVAVPIVPVPQKAILAIDMVNQAVSAVEDMLDVPARADLPILWLGPLEAAVAAPIVPVPQKAILAIDMVNQAASGKSRLFWRRHA